MKLEVLKIKIETLTIEEFFMYSVLSIALICTTIALIQGMRFWSKLVFYFPKKQKRNINRYSIYLRRNPTHINDNRIIFDNRQYSDSAIVGEKQ